MKAVTIYLPVSFIARLDMMIGTDGLKSRNAVIRKIIREYLRNQNNVEREKGNDTVIQPDTE